MKAEHRKELQTNVLADHLGRMLKSVRSGTKSSALIYWIIAALLVVLIAVWYFWSSSSQSSKSRLWVKLDAATSAGQKEVKDVVKDLQQIADDNRGTVIARTARFQMARLQLEDGLSNLGSDQRRAEAVENIEQARDLYQKLIPDCSDVPLLRQEAMMGVAKAEESLLGIPRADDPSQMRGTLAQALEEYQNLENATPESFQTRAAKKRAQELRDRGPAIEKFYADLNRRFAKASK